MSNSEKIIELAGDHFGSLSKSLTDTEKDFLRVVAAGGSFKRLSGDAEKDKPEKGHSWHKEINSYYEEGA